MRQVLHFVINQGLDVLEVGIVATDADDRLIVQLEDTIYVRVLGQTAVGEQRIGRYHDSILENQSHDRSSCSSGLPAK